MLKRAKEVDSHVKQEYVDKVDPDKFTTWINRAKPIDKLEENGEAILLVEEPGHVHRQLKNGVKLKKGQNPRAQDYKYTAQGFNQRHEYHVTQSEDGDQYARYLGSEMD